MFEQGSEEHLKIIDKIWYEQKYEKVLMYKGILFDYDDSQKIEDLFVFEDGVRMSLSSYVLKILQVINLPIGTPLFMPFYNTHGFIEQVHYWKVEIPNEDDNIKFWYYAFQIDLVFPFLNEDDKKKFHLEKDGLYVRWLYTEIYPYHSNEMYDLWRYRDENEFKIDGNLDFRETMYKLSQAYKSIPILDKFQEINKISNEINNLIK